MVGEKEKMVPVLSLFLAMFLWAGSFVALKIAFRAYDPMVVIFGRMAVACLCFVWFTGELKKVRYRKGDWKYFLLMGVFEPCLYFLFEARALENTSASQAGMITSMLPLMVALSAWLFLRETITWRTVTGFIIAVCGASILSISGDITESAPNPALGNFFEFLAMAMATGYTIVLKRLSDRYSPVLLTACQAFIGAVFFGMFLFFPSTRLPDHIDVQAVIAVVYLGSIVTMGAYFLYNYGVSKMPASKASAFVNLIPVFTVFLGWLILGETFTAEQYTASGAVFFGIYLSQS